MRIKLTKVISLQNLPVERKWVEFNTRVNYPIKHALNSMVNAELLNMDDDITKFCVSWLMTRVADPGIKQVIQSWNSHSIPGMWKHQANQSLIKLRKIVKYYLIFSLLWIWEGPHLISKPYRPDKANAFLWLPRVLTPWLCVQYIWQEHCVEISRHIHYMSNKMILKFIG